MRPLREKSRVNAGLRTGDVSFFFLGDVFLVRIFLGGKGADENFEV